MHHVFISYSRRDSTWVTELAEALSRSGIATWLDQRDIPVTVPWHALISDAITESALFLVCESAEQRHSAACAAEAAVASEQGKPFLRVLVGTNPLSEIPVVQAALRGIPPTFAAETELAVRARDWDRGGRSSRALLPYREQRRFARQLNTAKLAISSVQRAYLVACRRRSARRLLFAVIGGAIVGVAVLAIFAFRAANKQIIRINEQQATIYSRTSDWLDQTSQDPYEALRLASALGSNESAENALVIQSALQDPVPDDAFTVPATIRRFAVAPVGQRVIVLAEDGLTFGRGASSSAQRKAHRMDPSTAPPPPRVWTVHIASQSGAVDIFDHGVLYRRLILSSRPVAAAVSPDGREVAAIIGSEVDVLSVHDGYLRTRLRGAPGPLRDVAWGADGSTVWAVTRHMAVRWLRRPERVLVSEPGRWFQALLPAASHAQAWLVSRDGLLRRVDLTSGAVSATYRVRDEVLGAAGSADGSHAAVVGRNRTWLVSLATGRMHGVAVRNCDVGTGAALSHDGKIAYLPCLGSGILEVSTSNDQIIRRLGVPEPGAGSVAVGPRSGNLFVGSIGGDVLVIDRVSGSVQPLYQLGCRNSIRYIAVADNERSLMPVGDGTGMVNCTRVGIYGAGAWAWHGVIDAMPNSILSIAAAFDPSGKTFFIGYSDGSIVAHPTDNVLPSLTFTGVTGGIRGLLMGSNNMLYAVTRSGTLQAIPVCASCMSNRAMATEAHNELLRAAALHLTTLERRTRA